MSQNIINPKPCNYNCGTRIYWDNSLNSYLEVFTKKKRICPNRSSSNNNKNSSSSNAEVSSASTNKPNYYNKYSKQPKPKMSNSLEMLSGPISEVQKKYEILSDIVSEYNDKVHGSQSHINGNIISLVVYYEVPLGHREEVKQKEVLKL
ncbi:MAG: hypothetical protein AB7F53_04095 [Nitrososphaeraceae archaeon]